MRGIFFSLLVVPFFFSGCTKCVQCEVKLKESQTVLAFVDEFCGTDKKVEAEESRLNDEYTCIECVVNIPTGPQSSGVHCGSRAFTDSIEAGWNQVGIDFGTTTNCTYYRDTVNVTCVLN